MNDIEYKNKKIRNMKIYAFSGLGLLILANLLSFLNITIGEGNFFVEMLYIWSMILIVGSLAKYITFKRRPSLIKIDKITEYDERNVIIRGKSAYLSLVLSLVGLAIIDIILIYLEYTIPTYLVSGLIVISYVSFLIFVVYYDKKL